MTQPSTPSLLLVDNNAEALFKTAKELADLGCRVLVAGSVDQAIQISRRETFELLLCCEPLDFADASTLLRFFRRNKRLRQLRLVIKQPCQVADVCLKVINGEPIYCLGGTVSTESIRCILGQTMAMKPAEHTRHSRHTKIPYLHFNQRDPSQRIAVRVGESLQPKR